MKDKSNLSGSQCCVRRVANRILALLVLMAGVVVTACSKEDAESQANAVPAPVVEITSNDGIEIKPHDSMQQSEDKLRKLSTPAEPVKSVEITQPVPAQAISADEVEEAHERLKDQPGVAKTEPGQFQKASVPQTPAMRLEARNQAMADMLRVRKQAEGQGTKPEGGK